MDYSSIRIFRSRAGKNGRFSAVRINDKGRYFGFYVGTTYKAPGAIVVSFAKLLDIVRDLENAEYDGMLKYC